MLVHRASDAELDEAPNRPHQLAFMGYVYDTKGPSGTLRRAAYLYEDGGIVKFGPVELETFRRPTGYRESPIHKWMVEELEKRAKAIGLSPHVVKLQRCYVCGNPLTFCTCNLGFNNLG